MFSETTSELTKGDRQVVLGFFAKLLSIFGHGKYTAEFGDDDKPAKREWAHRILQYDVEQLKDRLDYAAETRTAKTFICIPDILNGRPPAPAAQQPIPDHDLMIPRSVCPGTPKQKQVRLRDTRGYLVKRGEAKQPVDPDAEEARRRKVQAQIEQLAKLRAQNGW